MNLETQNSETSFLAPVMESRYLLISQCRVVVKEMFHFINDEVVGAIPHNSLRLLWGNLLNTFDFDGVGCSIQGLICKKLNGKKMQRINITRSISFPLLHLYHNHRVLLLTLKMLAKQSNFAYSVLHTCFIRSMMVPLLICP